MTMDLDKSTRKPFVRPVEASWWTKKGFYLAYMLREGTCLLVLAFVLEMLGLYIMTALHITDIQHMNQAGLESLQSYIKFLGHPVMIAFNVLVLIAVLYHAFTWFPLMPKATRVIIKDRKSGLYKLLEGKYLVALLVLAFVATTAAGIIFFYYPQLIAKLLTPLGLFEDALKGLFGSKGLPF
jgi:fumarate reductase subunit C